MNLVYQEVIEEKLVELERMLSENREQQNEILIEVSGASVPKPTSNDLPPMKLHLGSFLKPYFRDKSTGLGPPANPETREKMSQGMKTFEDLTAKRWLPWHKALLHSAVVNDSRKRLQQPKLFKIEYMTQKLQKAENMEKQILEKQIEQAEREIDAINEMSDEQLVGSRLGEHDWEKISNIDFEGMHKADDIKRYWQNYGHPSINKSSWKEDEIESLKEIAAKYNCCDWEKIAEELKTNRTAYMCLQAYQLYINKGLRKKFWTKEEDQMLKDLVEKMRIGSYIPYTQISYFMEGREASQLVYRWTQSLDPSLRKGPWTKAEDEMLLRAVAKYGTRDWWKIRDEVPGRSDTQCRDRYLDSLSEDVKKGKWSPDEEQKLIMLVEKYGVGRWAKIASEIENRVDCQCLQKWKLLTRPKRRQPKKMEPTQRKRKRRRHSSMKWKPPSSEFEDSDEWGAASSDPEKSDSQEDRESEVSEEKDEYHMPSIDLWIPTEPKRADDTQLLWKPTVMSKSEKKNRPPPHSTPAHSSDPQHVAGPTTTTVIGDVQQVSSSKTNTSSALLEETSQSGNKMLKVTYNQVRNLLRSKTKFQHTVTRTKKPLQKKKAEAEEALQKSQSTKSLAKMGKQVQNSTLNEKLLIAVTPWVGNVLMPADLDRQHKRREADVIREKAEDIGLTSTPVFTLLIKVLHIDAEGCKKVIEERNKMEPSNNKSASKVLGEERLGLVGQGPQGRAKPEWRSGH
ncbi:SNPC4 protein, partial [Atractosteus spatula]|nr:SNPC4 protein [Atractosteus spatula]